MITLLINIVAFIVLYLVLYFTIPEKERKSDSNLEISGVLFFMFGIFNIIMFFVGGCNAQEQCETVTMQKEKLYTLSVKNNMKGDFSGFLGVSGTIEGKYYYVYYIKDGNKYKLRKCATDKASVVKNDDEHPYMIVKEQRKKVSIGPPLKYFTFYISHTWYMKKEAIFYVPPNSINRKFDANVQ